MLLALGQSKSQRDFLPLDTKDTLLTSSSTTRSLMIKLFQSFVADFIGISRSDYPLHEVHDLFKWGALSYMEVNKPTTFKGKELTLIKEDGRYKMKITMEKFIAGMTQASLPRGRLLQDEKLSDDEKKELRSISGSLQWLATQARPELSPVVSLTGHGDSATIHDLKMLLATVDYLKQTPSLGILTQDIPVDASAMVLAYSHSSWANASKSGSQIGVIIGLTTANVKDEPTRFSLLDWKSARAVRVYRSTLAAEASAADEAADRSAYVNMHLSEFIHLAPAHRVGVRLASLQGTDAKSLYDAVVSPKTITNDKRTMVLIRAIQETVSGENIRWVPARFQFSDGLTKLDEKLRLNFVRWLQNPFAILSDHPSNQQFEELCFQQLVAGHLCSRVKHQKKSTSVNFRLDSARHVTSWCFTCWAVSPLKGSFVPFSHFVCADKHVADLHCAWWLCLQLVFYQSFAEVELYDPQWSNMIHINLGDTLATRNVSVMQCLMSTSHTNSAFGVVVGWQKRVSFSTTSAVNRLITIDYQVLQLASLLELVPCVISLPSHFRLTVATSLGGSAVQIPAASRLIHHADHVFVQTCGGTSKLQSRRRKQWWSSMIK